VLQLGQTLLFSLIRVLHSWQYSSVMKVVESFKLPVLLLFSSKSNISFLDAVLFLSNNKKTTNESTISMITDIMK